MLDESAGTPTSGRRGRNLFLLWLAQFVSGTGDSVFSTCIGFLVIYLLGRDAGAEVGLTRMMDALPFLIFGAYAGVLVDRFSRRGMMLISDFVRVLVIGCVPLLYFTGVLAWWMLPGVAFLSYLFATVFNPARDALIPDLAEGANLLRVNSVFQTSQQLAVILGAGLVGLILWPELWGGNQPGPTGLVWLLAADAASFAFSFVCILLIRSGLPPQPARRSPGEVGLGTVPAVESSGDVPGAIDTHSHLDDGDSPHSGTVPRPSSFHELRESLANAWKDTRLRALLFLTAVDNFFIMGPAIVGGMFLIKSHLKLETWAYGVFEALLGAGWFVGTLLIARFGSRIKTGRLVIFGMFMDGITYVPFLWLDTFPQFLVAIFLHGLTIPLITVGRTTLIQRHYPRERLGRIFALVTITVQGFTALSALTTGLALGWIGPRELFFIGGACGAVCGVVGLTFAKLRATE
ncbi:MAG: MFS transporter [Planctomycetes bacterium]|nr:MFS transporter [Planctomycetota bacterium]